MYLTLLIDVEDFINPEADDIARTMAVLLTEEGVRATMCIVGERARQWRDRGRTDVITALGRHDIGYHTDLHSIHPTIAEYLGDKDWEAGISETLAREESGVRAVREVFGVDPSCWARPGLAWGPQALGAMPRLGVPAMVYAPSLVPDGDVHQFCGSLAYPDGPMFSDGRYQDTPEWQRQLDEILAELSARRDAGQQWSQVFLGHPTRILYEEFWDEPNFGRGRNPPPHEWVPVRRKSDADLATALANLRRTVRALKTLPGCEIATIREMNVRFTHAVAEPLTPEDQAAVAPEIDRAIAGMTGWVILPSDFDTAGLQSVAKSKLPTLTRLTLAPPAIGHPS